MRQNRVMIHEGNDDGNILCCLVCSRAKSRDWNDVHAEMDTAGHGAQCDYCGKVETAWHVTDPMPQGAGGRNA